MPLYDYHCQACGHQCELLEKIGAQPASECPACHQPELKRQVSAPQFQLKGSGWYVTDFKPGTKKTTEAPAKKESPTPAKETKE